MRRIFPSLAVCLVSAALVSPAASAQQAHHENDRVTSAVDGHQRNTLHGHLPRWASTAGDLGAVNTDVTLDHLSVVLTRSAATQAAFEQLLNDQQNPDSPRYQHWLTPQQVGEQFGPTDHDVDAVTQWLASQGMRVDAVSPSRTMVNFSGASGAVGRALGTEFHRYRVHTRRGDEDRLSIDSEPAIPAALTPVVAAFKGLSEEPEEPQSTVREVTAANGNVSPQITATCTGGVICHFLAPADFVTIFDIQPVYNAGFNGAGVKVAVIGRSRVLASDITAFQTTTGLASAQPVVFLAIPSADPGVNNTSGDQGEQTLDVNRVMSTAPGAETDLVINSNLDTAIQYEVNTLLDPIMTISYGGCESGQLSSVTFFNALFSTAASEGITTFVSSGDSGAAGCAAAFSASPASTPIASINAICSSSYVTCVGGTEFADTASPSSYWKSSSGTGLESAISYIPEGAWNEPTTTVSTSTPHGVEIAGTGGGVSLYITKPSWQTGTGVPADGFRDTPDVSFPAAGHDGYYLCLNALAGNLCNGSGSFDAAAGTSAAAPGMAGVMALVVQKLGHPQGNFNPTLYRLAAATALGVFHDTTPATSGVSSCSLSTASMCNNSTPGPSAVTGGLAGYAITTGYDLATGWGSIDVAKLLVAVVTPYVTPTVNLTATNPTVAPGGSDSFTATVSGTPGTPSGTVQFYDGSTALGSAVTLASGTATLSGQIFSTPGAHSITAQYAGDTVFIATTSSPFALTVTQATPTVTLNTSTTSLLVGQSPILTATVSGTVGTPTGTVQFLANNVNFGPVVTLVGGVATLSTQTFTTSGSYSVKAQYNGNTNYVAATSTATTIVANPTASSPYYTLTPATGTLTIASPGAATANTYNLTATSVNSFAGTVPLTCTVAYNGSGISADLPTCSLAPASITLAANGTAPTVATISTTAAHAKSSGTLAELAGAGGMLACILLYLPLRKKKLQLLLMLLAMLTIAGGLSGCGAGGTPASGPTDPGTTLGNYTVTVMGTSSGAATSTTFTLTVN